MFDLIAKPAFVLAAATLLAVSIAAPAAGQTGYIQADKVPEEFEKMEIVEHRDAQLPLELEFTNSDGESVTLGDYFRNDRPVIVALVYYRCPMLCTLVVNGTIDALKEIDWKPGEEYELVVVSFDHTETAELAKIKKNGYVAEYRKPGAEDGFHFLVGSEANVKKLADIIGFPFRWSEESEQFTHPSAIYIVTPEGRISKYLYGVMFEPKTVRLSLVEASEGRIGTLGDKITLFCSHYNPEDGTYAASAFRIMGLSAPVVGAAILVAVALAVRLARRSRSQEWNGGA